MKFGKLLLALLVCVLPSLAHPAEYSVIRQSVYPVIVHASAGPRNATVVSSGSAVMIDRGYALTAAHVVPESSSQSMYIITGKQSVVAVPVKIDRAVDLALLSVNIPCPCAILATHQPARDDDVWAVGYPMFLTYDVQFVTTGTVQGMFQGNIVSTANTAPGGSGGGLFSKEKTGYRLAGISVAIATTPIGPRLFSIEAERNWMMFSVPVSTIRSFLTGTPEADR